MPKRIFQGVSFVGIPSGVSRLLLENVATKEELEDFKKAALEGKNQAQLLRHIEYREGVPLREKKHQNDCKRAFYRKLWRKRHSENFTSGLYQVVKKIYRYEYYGTLPGGEGCFHNYYRQGTKGLSMGSLLMYSHHDEIGNVHFVTCEDNRTIGFKKAHAKLENVRRLEYDAS